MAKFGFFLLKLAINLEIFDISYVMRMDIGSLCTVYLVKRVGCG